MTAPPPVAELARADSLLVVTDFDGTIAPLHADPSAVVAHSVAEEALNTLARLPRTEVVVLSGRHLDGLRAVCPLEETVVLVGSHGAEPSPQAAHSGMVTLRAEDQTYLADIEAQLRRLVAGHEPAYVEVKPFQRVLHVAPLAATHPEEAAKLLQAARTIPTGGRPVTPGTNVVEFSAVDVSKGTWVARWKENFSATFFAGDDVTDESVFPVLGPHDVGVKVGAAPTRAQYRVPDVAAMADYYSRLADARGAATV